MAYRMIAERENETVKVERQSRLMIAAKAKIFASEGWKVVVTDGDNKVLAVDNVDALKGHEGHHVAVTGHVKGDSIHVESVKML